MDGVKVGVVDRGRMFFYMRYTDPMTGKTEEKSTKVKVDRRTTGDKPYTQQSLDAAKKVATKWEQDLEEGRYKPSSKVSWAEFRRRYENEVLPSLAKRTEAKVCGTFNAIERCLPIVKEGTLRLLTAARLSQFQAQLRAERLAEATIKGHLAHLLAALNWAKSVGMLVEVPEISMPKRAKSSRKMKGRPPTGEEFERMLAAVPIVVGPKVHVAKRKGGMFALRYFDSVHREWIEDPTSSASMEAAQADAERREAELRETPAARRAAESWRHLLRGLWWSGLRLAEAVALWWDREDRLCIVEDGERLMLLIHAHLEKGNQDRQLPIAPEFETFLREIPQVYRTGRAFRPLSMDGSDRQMTSHHVGRIISAIGEAAGVKVMTKPAADARSEGKAKFASAHDLRRAFGNRWARRVMPAVLQQLMRHESIETTLKYYVELDAKETAAELWRAVSDTSGDTRHVRAAEPSPAKGKARRNR